MHTCENDTVTQSVFHSPTSMSTKKLYEIIQLY